MLDFAVIIPCCNEGASIGSMLNDLLISIKPMLVYRLCRIYVYDNNSTDNTCAVVSDFIAKRPELHGLIVLRHAPMQGKGFVIRQAFGEINARCYCMIDGDDTYDTSKLCEMFDKVNREHFDMVVGDRLSTSYFSENKRPFHNFGNRLVRWSVNKIFDTGYSDILSGFRMFSYVFVKTFPITSGGFTLETEMNIHAAEHNLRVAYVPVGYRDRRDGSCSKLHTIPDGFKVLKKIIGMVSLYRPVLFYSFIALVLAVLGIGFGIPVLVDYFDTGQVSRFPTLIVCGFTMLAALLNYFMGILQVTNNARARQRFELSYIDSMTKYLCLFNADDIDNT